MCWYLQRQLHSCNKFGLMHPRKKINEARISSIILKQYRQAYSTLIVQINFYHCFIHKDNYYIDMMSFCISSSLQTFTTEELQPPVPLYTMRCKWPLIKPIHTVPLHNITWLGQGTHHGRTTTAVLALDLLAINDKYVA